MSKATDIITYIGVPLAVLGIMPLLWNMGKSFIIRHRLLRLIPNNLRKFFVVIMDPAAGTVSLSVQELFIDASSLLGYERVSRDLAAATAEKLPISTWKSVEYDPSIDKNSRKSPKRSIVPLYKVEIYNRPGPSSSWMTFVNAGVQPIRKVTSHPRGYTIDSALRCDPILLECSWPTFVYLSVAIGFNAVSEENVSGMNVLRTALQQRSRITLPITLYTLQGHQFLEIMPLGIGNVGAFQPGPATFSVRQMLAWENIMLPDYGNPLMCVTLPSLESFLTSDILAFSQYGLVRWRTDQNGSSKILAPHSREPYRSNNSTSEWRQETFRDALTWAIYAEQVFGGFSEILPTSQAFLAFQEKSIIWLGRMDPKKRAEYLANIFPDKKFIRDIEQYLEKLWLSRLFPAEKIRREINPRRKLLDLPLLGNPDELRDLLKELGKLYLRGIGTINTHRSEIPFDSDIINSKPKVLERLEHHEVYREIKSRFNPIAADRSNNHVELESGSLMEFMAHLLLATSIIRACPRAEWWLDWTDVHDDGWCSPRIFERDEYPLGQILQDSSQDPSNMSRIYLM